MTNTIDVFCLSYFHSAFFFWQVTFGAGAITDCVSLENTIEDQEDEGKDLYTQFNFHKVVQLS